jgi:hypothetical protein
VTQKATLQRKMPKGKSNLPFTLPAVSTSLLVAFRSTPNLEIYLGRPTKALIPEEIGFA